MRRGPKLAAVQRQPLLTGYLKQGFYAARALGGPPADAPKQHPEGAAERSSIPVSLGLAVYVARQTT
jgi:hypothetical protein